MGWDAAILVDGSPYQLLGVPPGNTTLVNAIQQSFIFTPTRSTFVLRAGPVDVTMTFMSPVEVHFALSCLGELEANVLHLQGKRPCSPINAFLLSILQRGLSRWKHS